ncbi:MAG: TonB-dependent receptor [Lysobacteraceae bacterium]|nr:MAG: TonB-dependent receptor [Xanthomonadaceae bacterium]
MRQPKTGHSGDAAEGVPHSNHLEIDMTYDRTRRSMRPACLPFAVAIALTPALMPLSAAAQDATPEEEDSQVLDRITVTGSRIPRGVEVEGNAPVLTLTREQIESTGLTSVGDVLFNLTATDGGALRNITTGTNGSDGTQNISLRGLGAQRTLVLVNGRRWVGDINGLGSTDLNTVPISVVERIEVLKDGASAIYGSDAIAGVINLITRKNFEGAEANAYLGEYSKGDGMQQAYDFTVGASGDRWNAVFSVGYTDQDPVFAGDRTISSVPVYGGGDFASGGAFGSGSPLYGNFVRCAGGFTVNPINGFRNCTATGGATTLNPGQDGRDPGDFRRWVGYTTDGSGSSDRYNFAPVNYLLQPIERFNVFGQGTLALTEKVNANVQAVYVKRGSVQQLAEVPLTMDVRGTAGEQWAFTPASNSVFNPFALEIRNFNFRAQAVGPRHNDFNNDNIAFTGWLDGNFELFGRTMYWDAGYSYLESRFQLNGDNYINLFNLRNAVGPSFRDPVSGALQCGTPGNVIRGCVPYNVFGGPDLGLGAGVISRAEYDAMNRYISYNLSTFTENTTQDYFANLSGELFELPAGSLGFAVGVEHRKSDFLNQPDALVAGGGSSNNFSEPTNGNVSVDEYFAEFNVPILAEIAAFKSLELNLAVRRSDYDSSGFFGGRTVSPDIGGDTAKKLGLKWQVYDDLMIRGTYSESFRAPSLAELFAGLAETFPIATDPCNTARIAQPATDSALCFSEGVPGGGAPQPNPQIRSLTSGNPDLKPESGKTRSFGVVYSPGWLEGLDLTLDWYKLDLTDVIVARGTQATLDGCYTFVGSATGAPNAATRQLFCDLIDRDPSNGQLTRVQQSSFNLASGVVEGYDLQVVYRLRDTAWGNFSFQWDSNYQVQNNLFGVVGQYAGAPTWRLRSNFNVGWQKGDWDATWAMRYYSGMDEACPFGDNYFEYGITPTELCKEEINDSNGNFLRSENRIPAVTYHDVQVGWKTPWNGKIALGARNIFGKEPPITRTSFAHSFDGAYDLPGGAFFYLQYNQKF